MANRPRAIAHEMLTQALALEQITAPALVGADLATAAIWLRQRAAGILTAALRPQELLAAVAASFAAEHPAADPNSPSNTTWQYAAALKIAEAELAGDGKMIDPSTVENLTRDPDGMLTALAELTAHLYRIHDGPGATAVVRAQRP